MKVRRKKRLMTQMLAGQVVLIVITGLTLIATASFIAPPIFNKHLSEAGITSAGMQVHIFEAFASSFNYAFIFAAISSLAVSGIIAWHFVRRIVRPIENVTQFAESLASGDSAAQPRFDRSSPELDRLAHALDEMSSNLTISREVQDRMLGDLAHELRTPIATVSAIVDGIEDGVVPADSHAWKTIRDQLERVNRLSHDVREVSTRSDKVLSTFAVKVQPEVLIRDAFSAWRAKVEGKGLSLGIEIEPDLPELSADPDRIGQVLSNLLENALRFTPAGGVIFLRAYKSDDSIVLEVQDSGQGIDEHQLPHIFERLYRGDMARHSGESGSGLGLTIARSIAESHNGSLTALSAGKDLGSTFILSLPIAQD